MTEPFTHIIYVAGPYRCPTKKGVQRNINRALVAAQRLWDLGYVAFCPHANSPHFQGRDWWFLRGYIEVLSRCDAGVRPKDVEDKKTSLEDRLKSGFMAAYRQRVATATGEPVSTN